MERNFLSENTLDAHATWQELKGKYDNIDNRRFIPASKKKRETLGDATERAFENFRHSVFKDLNRNGFDTTKSAMTLDGTITNVRHMDRAYDGWMVTEGSEFTARVILAGEHLVVVDDRDITLPRRDRVTV